MKALQTTLFCGALALTLLGCEPGLCERSAAADKKVASACAIEPTLGNSCSSDLKSCSEADTRILTDAVACIEKLTVCQAISKDAWKLNYDACVAPVATVSQPCAEAFFMGMPPGFDAGTPDAGVQSINDGGSALTLYGAANQDTVALAWVPKQDGQVTKWMLVESDALGDNRTETELPAGTLVNLTIPDAGMNGRRYYVFALNPNNAIVFGTPFMTAGPMDGGPMCTGPSSCAADRVCDLGQCKLQTCVSGGTNTCPPGYGCLQAGYCYQTGADGGFVIGGGTRDGGSMPLPFVSNEIGLTPRPPMVQPVVQVGQVAGRRPDIVGVDTARLALALEQEGQVVAHSSEARGADLIDDALTAAGIDTLGGRVHLAFNHASKTLYACYVVGRGVRVQKSTDLGRTWGSAVRTFEPPLPDDGGIGDIFRDCDIAAWKNGGAMLVTAEPEALYVYDLAQDLSTNMRGPAFVSTGDGGVTNPSRPAIATAPDLDIVHVTFTGTRESGAGSDSEPYAVNRIGAGPFSNVSRMTPFTSPSAGTEDYTAVAVHPRTGRAVGAFTSTPAGSMGSTVYIALYNAATRGWSTGTHLNVFTVDQNTSVWLPQKPPAEAWFAFSPSFAPLPDGTFAFSFVAGPRTNGIADYRQYMVPFDLDRTPSITSGKGWFIPPVLKMSDDKVLDPRGSLSAPQPPVSAIASDSQLSVYGVYVPGTGVNSDVEGPAKYFHWP